MVGGMGVWLYGMDGWMEGLVLRGEGMDGGVWE